jgi:hypothetical protein
MSSNLNKLLSGDAAGACWVLWTWRFRPNVLPYESDAEQPDNY